MSEYQSLLSSEQERLIKELQTIAVQNDQTGDWVAKPQNITNEADPNDVADGTEDWNERRATVAQLEMRYHNVTLALKKFAIDTFGVCEVCQDEIETDRLVANPAARTCKIHLERERELPF